MNLRRFPTAAGQQLRPRPLMKRPRVALNAHVNDIEHDARLSRRRRRRRRALAAR